MIVLYTTERDYPWGTLRSTHASKTKVVLEEKQIPYRIENLPPGNLWKKPPEMLAKHPLGKVPYIEEQDRVIFDSTVIDEYLEERYQTGTRLMPLDPAARVQVREAEQFGDEALLSGSVPLLWMPYWSEPAKRDADRMEQAANSCERAISHSWKGCWNAVEAADTCAETSRSRTPPRWRWRWYSKWTR